MRFTLPKSEILRGYKSFTRVITTGKNVNAPPIRCFHIRSSSDNTTIAAGFTVTRSIRRAVDRNRAKRLMRESYRTIKEPLVRRSLAEHAAFEIVFMYTGRAEDLRKKNSFSVIDRSIKKLATSAFFEERN